MYVYNPLEVAWPITAVCREEGVSVVGCYKLVYARPVGKAHRHIHERVGKDKQDVELHLAK